MDTIQHHYMCHVHVHVHVHVHAHVHVVALQAVLGHLPKSLLLCREARAFTLDLMPFDILDFLELWPLLKHHSLLVVLAGIMEEPTATSAWRGTPLLKALAAAQGKSESKVQVDAEIVYCSLEQVVQVLEQARDNSDCAVGAAPLSRFMSTMQCLGIAVPDKSKKEDCMTRDTRKLASLIVAADSLQSLWVDMLISEDVEIISDNRRVCVRFGDCMP